MDIKQEQAAGSNGAHKTWEDWRTGIWEAIASVPDETLRRVAEVIREESDIVLTAGNGGSAAIASHAAQGIAKPDYKAGGGFPVVCLTDCIPLLTAHTNDGGWHDALVESSRFLERPCTTYLLISSSGKSENLVRLAKHARERNHQVIAFTGFTGGPLRDLATVSIHVASDDYEIVEPVHEALLHRVQYHLREGG